MLDKRFHSILRIEQQWKRCLFYYTHKRYSRGVITYVCFVKRIFIYFLVLLFFKSKRVIHFSLNGPLKQRETRLIVCVFRVIVESFRFEYIWMNGFIYGSLLPNLLPHSDSFPLTARVGITSCTMHLYVLYIYNIYIYMCSIIICVSKVFIYV